MASPALVIVQSFTYRDIPEEFSNKYWFVGPAPNTSAEWLTLTNALLGHLAPCFPSAVTFHRAYGYYDGSQPSVWSHDWTIPGPPPGGTRTDVVAYGYPPGDVAATLRWATDKRNSKGKIIYLRKYFHHQPMLSPGDPDKIEAIAAANMLGLGQACVNGTISSAFHVCTPDGQAGHTPEVSPWLTTRTLKRRGKRPPT